MTARRALKLYFLGWLVGGGLTLWMTHDMFMPGKMISCWSYSLAYWKGFRLEPTP